MLLPYFSETVLSKATGYFNINAV